MRGWRRSAWFSEKRWSGPGRNGARNRLQPLSSQGRCREMRYLDEAFRVKIGLAEMLKGGVIMDVTDARQAEIAEKAGACAVMALERVPADIRKEGGVARMAAPKIIR